jgi:hypothetical protein
MHEFSVPNKDVMVHFVGLRQQVSQDAENDMLSKIELLQREHRAKAEAMADELKASRQEAALLKREVLTLRDSTLVGEKQRELDRERADNRENLHLLEAMRVELEMSIADRELLAGRLTEIEARVDQRVAERVVAEREKIRILERSLHTTQQRLDDESDKVHDLEAGQQVLTREIDELTNWRTVYESGHGLQELARNQKKLKDDNRRLGVAGEQTGCFYWPTLSLLTSGVKIKPDRVGGDLGNQFPVSGPVDAPTSVRIAAGEVIILNEPMVQSRIQNELTHAHLLTAKP